MRELDKDNNDQLMEEVFNLRYQLDQDPERVRLTQELTLDPNRPKMGLRGTHGLFGSAEWWRSIETGAMPLEHVSGVIRRAYRAGQDNSGPNNTIDVMTSERVDKTVGIYVNDAKKVKLFQVGRNIDIVYALDELKKQPAPDGEVNYSRVALRMCISLS